MGSENYVISWGQMTRVWMNVCEEGFHEAIGRGSRPWSENRSRMEFMDQRLASKLTAHMCAHMHTHTQEEELKGIVQGKEVRVALGKVTCLYTHAICMIHIMQCMQYNVQCDTIYTVGCTQHPCHNNQYNI